MPFHLLHQGCFVTLSFLPFDFEPLGKGIHAVVNELVRLFAGLGSLRFFKDVLYCCFFVHLEQLHEVRIKWDGDVVLLCKGKDVRVFLPHNELKREIIPRADYIKLIQDCKNGGLVLHVFRE